MSWGTTTPFTLVGTTTSRTLGRFEASMAVTFTVPSTATPGSYSVCAKGQSSGAIACRPFNGDRLRWGSGTTHALRTVLTMH